MIQQMAVIYIPGLGDMRTTGQSLAVHAWRLQGVQPQLLTMHWHDSESFDAKLERLLSTIDSLAQQGRIVSLIAASAGASAALNAYAARQDTVHGLVSICGKLQGSGNVHPDVYSDNPAFSQSMQRLQSSHLQLEPESRQRILSLRASGDLSVPATDTQLEGAAWRTMPVAGHFAGIAYGLTIGSFGAIRFLKHLPPKAAAKRSSV